LKKKSQRREHTMPFHYAAAREAVIAEAVEVRTGFDQVGGI
jgi:hypothetical protein